MKKHFLKFGFCGLLSLSLLSCEKSPMNTPLQESKTMAYSTTTNGLRALELEEKDIYLFPEDANYEKIDMGRYALGKALKDLITPELLGTLMAYAKEHYVNIVPFNTIFAQYPSLELELNQRLAAQQLTSCPYDFSTFDKINSTMSRNGISYNLGLYIYNLAAQPSTQSFILSPGLELLDEENTFEDQVMAWYKQDISGSIKSVKITEVEASSATATFLTIGLGQSPTGPGSGPGNATPTGPTPGVSSNICMRSLNIHYRYEKHSKSEVYIQAIHKNNTAYDGTFGAQFFVSDYSKHLVSTKKKNEWVDVDQGQSLFSCLEYF